MSMMLQKILAGVLVALMLIKGMDLIIDSFMPAEVEQAASKGGGEAGAAQAAAPAPEKPLPARLAAADPKKGEAISAKCASCHTFNAGGPTRVGPNLAGVVGRDKASVAGFAYSDALKKVGGKWDYESLDKWLEKPSAFAPGTKMTFAGLSDGQDRANLIAFLKSDSPDAPPFPQ
jgi:cytochrome c